jgi:hypothetical protein
VILYQISDSSRVPRKLLPLTDLEPFAIEQIACL